MISKRGKIRYMDYLMRQPGTVQFANEAKNIRTFNCINTK